MTFEHFANVTHSLTKYFLSELKFLFVNETIGQHFALNKPLADCFFCTFHQIELSAKKIGVCKQNVLNLVERTKTEQEVSMNIN